MCITVPVQCTEAPHLHCELVARSDITYNQPIQEITSYLGTSHRQLHCIRKAEGAACISENEHI